MSDPNITSSRDRFSWRTPQKSRNFWITVLLIIICIGIIRHCSSSGNNKSARAASEVVLATVKTKNVPVYVSALGNVTPTYSVTIRTQVNGILQQVLYKEGQIVHKGDLLAEIDPSPYLAQLDQYNGELKRDQALLANANVDLKRYQKLWHQDSVAQQTLATQQSLVQQYEGAVKTDQGLIESAKVNLAYTHITSPIDGRVGLRLVDPGNVVQTTDTNGLMVINTLDPITVIFTIPENDIPEVAKRVYDNSALTIESYDRNQNILLATSNIVTIDNQIDPTTGTVKLRAQFPNGENRLFPGQFVNIKLLVKTLLNATIAPTEAIQFDNENKPFVYTLNNDLTVSVKPVTTGPVSGNDTTILSGLVARQLVVVEGADKLINGAKVKVAASSQALLQPSLKTALKQRARPNVWRWFL